MSNALSIVAVTDTLRNLLLYAINADDELAGAQVTTSPLDKARGGGTPNQLNLFLYQMAINPAWCNMVIPARVKGGESGFPPLALDLYYLVTAYGSKDDETLSHRLLGQAMRCLHDHTTLETEELRNALPGNDLHAQGERVRITLQPLSLEAMSNLLTTFRTIPDLYQKLSLLDDATRFEPAGSEPRDLSRLRWPHGHHAGGLGGRGVCAGV